MMIRKLTVAALSTAMVIAGVGTSPADQGRKGQEGREDHGRRRAALELPITGTVAGGGTFAGTLDLQRFVVRDGQVAAVVMVRGTVMSAAGTPVGSALVGPVALPVQVSAAATLSPTAADPEATAAPGAAAAPLPAQASTCQVLHIDLGAANLNVLGVQVMTQPIGLDLSGDAAGPLGHLVCAILDTLNNVVGLVDLLNRLLGVLTGLLGGLVP